MPCSTNSTVYNITAEDNDQVSEYAEGGQQSEFEDGTDQPKSAADQQQKILVEKIAKMELEFENKILQAELKEHKLMAEHNALKAKVAKMEQEQKQHNNNGKTAANVWGGDQLKQLQNVQRALLARIDELEQQLKQHQQDEEGKYASTDQLTISTIGGLEQKLKLKQDKKEGGAADHQQTLLREKIVKMEMEFENKLLRAELKEQKLLAERNALQGKVAKMEQEQQQHRGKDSAAVDDRFNAFSKQISELEKQQQQNDQQQAALCAKIEQLEGKQTVFEQLKNTVDAHLAKIDGISFLLQNSWDATACHGDLTITGPKCSIVHYTGNGNDEFRSVFAKHSFPSSGPNIFYFEMTIKKMEYDVGIGLATKVMPLYGIVGIHSDSYAYYSSGRAGAFRINGSYQREKPSFTDGDVVGCGVNLANRQIIFTKNGQRLDTTDLSVSPTDDPLFPCVSLSHSGEMIEANFGPNFKFDVRTLC